MQRRTAAIYAVFFVVVAIGAYSLTTVAEEPTITIEGQEFSGTSTINVSGETYTINVSGGSGQVSTVNESARFTAALADNTTLRLVNGTYQPVKNDSGGGGATGGSNGSNLTSRLVRVVIPNATNATGNASAGNATNASTANITTFTLREVLDVQGLLVADPAVANKTFTTANGTKFVRYRNGTTVSLRKYLPPITTRNVSVGEQFPYQGNLTTVTRVNSSAATLAWQGSVVETQEFEEGQNVTIGKTTYVAHFPSNSTVILSQKFIAYQQEQQDITDFHNRILGLWGIVIISLSAAILIIGLAYLPVRG